MLSRRVTQVTLKNALTSYSDVAEAEDYDWPLSSFVPGVLEDVRPARLLPRARRKAAEMSSRGARSPECDLTIVLWLGLSRIIRPRAHAQGYQGISPDCAST